MSYDDGISERELISDWLRWKASRVVQELSIGSGTVLLMPGKKPTFSAGAL